MLNEFMKRSQLILFLIMIICLFCLNKFVMNAEDKLSFSPAAELVNHEHVSSQKLFDNVWVTVKNNYYDSSLNHQTWARWKEHYRGKIKTDEDAKVAIRNVRRDMVDDLKKIEKEENLPEDTVKGNQEDIQKLTDKFVGIIDSLVSDKEKEVMTV